LNDILKEFREQCQKVLTDAFKSLDVPEDRLKTSLKPPSRKEFGELSSSICFDVARELKKEPKQIADTVLKKIDFHTYDYVADIKEAGGGYINFHLDYEETTPRILEEVLERGVEYGYVKTDRPLRIVVEHTSVNPVHAIHIGQARNVVLGDSIAKILKARGHLVKTHYYIDDMGRQSAILAYGYARLGTDKIEGKPDHLLGDLYSLTNCIMQVKALKKRVNSTPPNHMEDLNSSRRSLDEWVSIAAELQEKHPELFNKLTTLIEEGSEAKVASLIKEYELKKPKAVESIRKTSERCIDGFKETLSRLGVEFDSWDWESDIVWGSSVKSVLEKLRATGYVYEDDGSIEFDAGRIIEDLDLRSKLGLTETYEVPSLTLARSDGTTLYTTRDVAYTLYKFKNADRVVNVIGAEQRLAQIHVKAALYAIKEASCADNLTHFAFGLVEMPGFKMSSRRGRLVRLDSVIEESHKRAQKEVEDKSEELSEAERLKIAKTIAIAAIKYALVSVEPVKTVVFTWDRVLSLEKNSAPFINYAYTRASGILNKMPPLQAEPNFKLLKHPVEKTLVLQIAKFPEVFEEAADRLKPENIAAFSNDFAEIFHEYYEKVNVIRTESKELRTARAKLIEVVKTVLNNSMTLLGITLTTKM